MDHRCVSRSRFWGTPLPIWVSEDGEERVVVSSIAQLEELTGEKVNDALHAGCLSLQPVVVSALSRASQGTLTRRSECWTFVLFWFWVVCMITSAFWGGQVTDLHRHFIDHLTIPSREGRGVLRRVDEVFDCWFESGSMPYAQLHYPFENTKFFEENFPADFVAEGALTSPKALLVVYVFFFMLSLL